MVDAKWASSKRFSIFGANLVTVFTVNNLRWVATPDRLATITATRADWRIYVFALIRGWPQPVCDSIFATVLFVGREHR